ncbi:MAG: DNA polymerase III subunit gamma/tau [Acidimicrobiales bacterium]
MTDLSPDADAGARRPERPYQSLYRRYRPQRFAEVRGQDHVTRALRNAVRDERIAHAYLFSGPRGTGKTSTARILAKALNCTAPEGGEPCGTCASCLSIVAGTSFDVHELDAASNNGVDAMRDLVGRAALATPGRWKVYIVDEVHMLSTAASNALLKTLEEPPEHVVFVLATTDPQKVLPTIRSRTQHFEFHLLGDDVLEGLLEDVVADAGLDLPDGGIGVALRRGRGSARDALSMLDQVSASGSAEDDSGNLGSVVTGIARRDTAAAIAALDDALRRGRDPQQVAVELVERLRSGFLALVAPGTDGADAGGMTTLEEARVLGTARCVRAMELLGAAIVAMRDAPEPRITLEVALVRCAHPDADETVESLLDRLEHVERRLDHLERGGAAASGPPGSPGSPDRHARSFSPAPATARKPPPATAGGPGAETIEVAPATVTPATAAPPGRPVLGAYRRRADPGLPEQQPARQQPATGAVPAGAAPVEPRSDAVPDRDELVSAWGDRLLVGLRPKVRAYYQAGHFVGTEGGDAIFALPNAVHVNQAEPLRGEVADALAAHFGRPIGLRLVVDGTWQPGGGPAPGADATGGAVGSARAAPTNAGLTASARATAEAEDEDVEELLAGGTDGLAPDTGASGLAWEEDRLLQAFPGAEEV